MYNGDVEREREKKKRVYICIYVCVCVIYVCRYIVLYIIVHLFLIRGLEHCLFSQKKLGMSSSQLTNSL